jgi:hypothetical protein
MRVSCEVTRLAFARLNGDIEPLFPGGLCVTAPARQNRGRQAAARQAQRCGRLRGPHTTDAPHTKL